MEDVGSLCKGRGEKTRGGERRGENDVRVVERVVGNGEGRLDKRGGGGRCRCVKGVISKGVGQRYTKMTFVH